MIVGVDEARDDEPVARVHDLGAAGVEILSNRDDSAVLDQDVGDLGLMDVAVMIVDLAATDDDRFLITHLCPDPICSSCWYFSCCWWNSAS